MPEDWNPRRERDVATGDEARTYWRARDRVTQLERELATLRCSKNSLEADARRRGRDPKTIGTYRQLAADELRLEEERATAQEALEAATDALARAQRQWNAEHLAQLYEHLDMRAAAVVQALGAASAVLRSYTQDRLVFAEMAPQSAHPPDLGSAIVNHLVRTLEVSTAWLGRADRPAPPNGKLVVHRAPSWAPLPAGHARRAHLARIEAVVPARATR